MSLYIASLNSGSNGNCYYVGNEEEAVLIDAGLTLRETDRRMKQLGLPMQRVKAIFITHEHSDHILGAGAISRKHQLPVFATPGTAQGGRLGVSPQWAVTLRGPAPVQLGGLTVTPFAKHHDAREPYSFTITDGRTTVGVFTDIGRPCEQLRNHFSQCHAAFLESNYDEEMLLNGRYTWYLKNRIRSGNGHLSNAQALEVFMEHRHPQLSHLLLAHLSKENNCPELALDVFAPHAGPTEVIVASRWEPTGVYFVSPEAAPVTPPGIKLPGAKAPGAKALQAQLSLF